MTNKKNIVEEFIFIGTPDEFKRLIQGDEYYELIRELNKRGPQVIKPWNPFSSQNESSNERFHMGDSYQLAIKPELGNTSRIIVEYNEPSISWEALKSKLINLSLIEKVHKKTKRKSGRPHYQDDVWAWEEIHKHGRNRDEVYKKWADRPGVKARNLVDLERQFKRISKPSWMK